MNRRNFLKAAARIASAVAAGPLMALVPDKAVEKVQHWSGFIDLDTDLLCQIHSELGTYVVRNGVDQWEEIPLKSGANFMVHVEFEPVRHIDFNPSKMMVMSYKL